MSKHISPSHAARETLQKLAEQKLVPTPENYAKVYNEITGHVAKVTSSDGSTSKKPIATIESSSKLMPAWSELIRDLLRQIETPHKGLTLTRKKEGVETVLSRFSSDSEALFEKLQGLIRSWSSSATPSAPADLPTAPVENALSAPTVATQTTNTKPGIATAAAPHSELLAQLRELLAQSLDNTLPSHPELGNEIRLLASQVRATNDATHINDLAKQLRGFWLKLELRGGDKIKIQEGLLRLLRLLVENVSELVADDKWLHGQISTLQDIITQPLDKRAIADAERGLRNAIIKQSTLKQSLHDAKATLKSLMTTFIDRLGDLTESTGEYRDKLEVYSQKISRTDNLTELGHLLEDIMVDTRTIQASAARSHEEMVNTRKQANDAEDRVKQLEHELEQVSELVREDHLTGALNRRGLDEVLDTEMKRADRNKSPVSISLIDIDNFKQLNDVLGHQAGDQALAHLIKVIKDTLRPTDSVGRYGGEEFIVILPDTELTEAVDAIQRLQRELTKKFFLHNNERLLITFSAGVALREENEDFTDLVGRADKAMYAAKKAGKNRVLAAESGVVEVGK